MKILFLDTETTGPDPALAKVCEIAQVLYDPDTDKILEEMQSLVNPGEPIPPEASAVNNITNAMVAGKPSLIDIQDELKIMVDQADYVCAHNINYDMEILTRELPICYGLFDKDLYIDTLRWARHILRGIPSHALQVLRYRYDLRSTIDGEAHRSLFDVGLGIEVFKLLQKQQPIEIKDLPVFIAQPLIVDIINFGKHRGADVVDAMHQDPGWFDWFLKQPWSNVEHPDLVYTISKLRSKS